MQKNTVNTSKSTKRVGTGGGAPHIYICTYIYIYVHIYICIHTPIYNYISNDQFLFTVNKHLPQYNASQETQRSPICFPNIPFLDYGHSGHSNELRCFRRIHMSLWTWLRRSPGPPDCRRGRQGPS